MLNLFRRSALLAVLSCLAWAGSAHAADTISLSFGADPTEEVPFTVTATMTQSDAAVRVTRKPAGGLGCAANYAADDPNSSDVLSGTASTGTLTRNWDEEDPGDYTFCGYVQKDGATTATTGPVNLTVRDAKASLSLTVPARVDAEQAFELVAQVTAELSRSVRVTIKPAGGRGCEANYSADDPVSSDVLSDSAQGTKTLARTITSSSSEGTYLLCGYVQESSQGTPEAVASTQFLVGPDPCVVARAAEARATKAVRVAETAAARYRRSSKRYAARSQRTSGAAARRWRALSRRDRSRYRSAIRRRAKARTDLFNARVAVKQACG